MNRIRVLRDYTTTNMVLKLTPPNCPRVSRNSNGRASLFFLKRLKGVVIIDTKIFQNVLQSIQKQEGGLLRLISQSQEEKNIFSPWWGGVGRILLRFFSLERTLCFLFLKALKNTM